MSKDISPNTFSRAREELMGYETFTKIVMEQSIGLAIYKANLTFHDGATYGEVLDIRTSYLIDGQFRIVFRQEAWRPNGTKPAVIADIQAVCIDRQGQMVKIPQVEGFNPVPSWASS